MKMDEVTVEVKAKLDVDKNTAEACLKMVEVYVNNNKDIVLNCARKNDGTEHFYFGKRAFTTCADEETVKECLRGGLMSAT